MWSRRPAYPIILDMAVGTLTGGDVAALFLYSTLVLS